MGVTIGVALVWTFGLTQLVIGHLNVATAFSSASSRATDQRRYPLQARYYEERRRGVPAPDALRVAVHETWQPTVIAALASAASYVSLMVTDFSAFRDFGFIARADAPVLGGQDADGATPLAPVRAASPVDESKQTGPVAGCGVSA